MGERIIDLVQAAVSHSDRSKAALLERYFQTEIVAAS
jgi:hypothetical protein